MAWYSGPLPLDAIEWQRGLPAPRFQPGEVVRSVGWTANSPTVGRPWQRQPRG